MDSWINDRSPGFIRGRILSCPWSWRQCAGFCQCSTHNLPLPLIQNASSGARPPCSLITACECRSHVRMQTSGGVKATTEYNRVELIMNKDLTGKYLCTCAFLKVCIQLVLQRAGWKSTAYPLFIPLRGYCYPFGPESLANIQIVFVEETENWIVYKQGSNPVYLLKMGIKLYFS